MRNIKLFIRSCLSILLITIALVSLAACASTANISSKTNTSGSQDFKVVENNPAAPYLQKLPEISSVKTYPMPSEKLPGIKYSGTLSQMALSSDLKNISVVSTSVNQWQPKDVFIDVYVYDKAAGKYIACVKNCYQDAIWLGQWGQLGNVWKLWVKDDAVYLINSSDYVLTTKDGYELINGYLAEAAFDNIKISLDALGWQPEGETADFYLYSKKENKFVTYIKDCWRNAYTSGMKGWGNNVKNAYRLITTSGTQYLIEESDYNICNEDGYEYISGWLSKTAFENFFIAYGQINWQPQGEIRDYYLYSKKQKKIVTCIKDCWAQAFSSGINGWNGNIKNAYQIYTKDGKRYLAESSDYILCNEQGYEYVNGFQYKFEVLNPQVLGTENSVKKGNLTVCENPVRELLYICKLLSECPSIVDIYDDESYLADIKSYFADFKNHEVVTFIKNNIVCFEKDDLEIARAVYAACEKQVMSKESDVLPCGNDFNYKEFFMLLADFAEKSNFKKFFELHQKYYEKHVIQNGFDAFEGVRNWNEEFLRQNKKIEYKICMHREEWCDVNYDDKNLQMTINLTVTGGQDYFGLAHEFSHPIINPVVKKLYESVLRPFMDSYFLKHLGTTAAYHYPDAYSYWCDTFARAAAGSYGHSCGAYIKSYCESQSRIGFTAVPELTEKLIELSSAKYESFDELYPQIFSFLKGYLVK